MKIEIELTPDQFDNLNRLLNRAVTLFAGDAAALMTVTGDHAQLAADLTSEYLTDVRDANELIALLLEQCG